MALGGVGAPPGKAQAPQMDVSSLLQAGRQGEQGRDKAQDRSGGMSAAEERKGASGCRNHRPRVNAGS